MVMVMVIANSFLFILSWFLFSDRPRLVRSARLWERPKVCVWGLAHAIKTGHLLNRSGYRIANWFRAATHSLTQRPFFSKLRIAR